MSSPGDAGAQARNLLDAMEEQEERIMAANRDDDDDMSVDTDDIFASSLGDDEEEGSSTYDSSTMATSEGDLFEEEDQEEDGDESAKLLPVEMEYDWTPPVGPRDDAFLGSPPALSIGPGQKTDSSKPRRSSLRRASSERTAEADAAAAAGGSAKSKRRITISVPTDETGQIPRNDRSMSTMRRGSVRLNREKSKRGSRESTRTGLLQNLKSTISFRRSGNKTSSGSGETVTGRTLDSAVSALGRGQTNANWNDVAAAAALVAENAAPRQRIQFFVGDNVLAFLNVLNHTNTLDIPEFFSIDPVNEFGYPPGEGETHAEQRGPYVYILATVKRVHFDEDVPYYTVARADTGSEQRCEAAWMEPLATNDGLEAARRAAKRTAQSTEEDMESAEELGLLAGIVGGLVWWPIETCSTRVIPFYRKTRASTKEAVSHMLYGDSPFACRVRITGVNLLVFCSLIFVFIEHIQLAFLPASTDYAVTVLALVVWLILAVELIFEWITRPSGYLELIRSDKAYAPSTQRYIDSFHLVTETVALALFIPELLCLSSGGCGERGTWTGINAALQALRGSNKKDAALGRLCLGLTSIRMYGLVRHWRNMWLSFAFSADATKHSTIRNFFSPSRLARVGDVRRTLNKRRHSKIEENTASEIERFDESTETSEEDLRLKKAATIGTALMVANSHRALGLLTAIAILVPMSIAFLGTNRVAYESVELLFANNIEVPFADEANCTFLETTINAWLSSAPISQTSYRIYEEASPLLWAQLLPVRCDFQRPDGVITACPLNNSISSICQLWNARPDNPEDATPQYYGDLLDIRVGAIVEISRFDGGADINMTGSGRRSLGLPDDPLRRPEKILGNMERAIQGQETFSVDAIFDQNSTVGLTHLSCFCLVLSFLVLCLCGLTVLRIDADRLVLDPLQRMLKIVVRYAENPLSETASDRSGPRKSTSFGTGRSSEVEDDDDNNDGPKLGNYETEQLINAISKITDLLRKCWGVAGAGIISSNLARTHEGATVMFNPTVPGKRVYALFGFVAIDGFSDQLRLLDADVMILINDVARVVHDEVYRWALGDSGQCNKNLGSAFLMVFRIGDFTEVHEKKARATDVVFSSAAARKGRKSLRRRGVSSRGLSRRRSARTMRGEPEDTLQLASLPGIQAFSDRALLGLLKSFAGVDRDKGLQKWKNDFRLSAGVGAFSGVSLIYGMDAGWAVEGAVGSSYKIDATYLSPHVNMASRMMSASKQYGVHILLSQAVEEILSSPARAKLRHLDTVYVKGSSVEQRVYTFDARVHGADFFLYDRTDEQADYDAEMYSPAIWNTDPDIRAMRQHVTEDFEKKYKEGKDMYLRGDWMDAVVSLTAADDIMIRNVLEEGFIDYNPDEIDDRIFDRANEDEELVRIRNELGDGACRCLISYMERRGCTPPTHWAGVRPLTSK